MGRAPCCDKANVKKGPWSPDEDAKLKSYIDNHGTGGNWISLPQKIGLKRCGKSCRLRWLNYLRPNIKHGGFSDEEDNLICSLYISIGSRWSIIAAQLPGRTDNDIKNYWNTRLKKKLLGKQQRKEKRQLSRGGGKHHQNYSGGVSSSISGQTPVAAYEPPLPHDLCLLPPIPYSSDRDPRSVNDDHASIRKLLIQLGGRFSNGGDQNDIDNTGDQELKFHYPANVDESVLIQPVINYDNSMDLMTPYSSCSQIPLISTTTFHDVPRLPNAPDFDMSGTVLNGSSIERVMYENREKIQGMEFFCDDIINGTYNTASIDNWGEINSLVFGAATTSNTNEGFLRGSITEEEEEFAIY